MTEEDVEVKAKAIESFIQIKGIGSDKAEKLYEAGYTSLKDIAVASVGDFIDRTGMSKKAAETIILNAKGLCNIGKIISATEKLVRETEEVRLKSGNSDLDELLHGGIRPGLITEFHGENGSGKTQTCLTYSAIATRPVEEGGLGGCVIYIDTENTFSANRLKQIAESRGYDPEETLDKVYLATAHNTSDLILNMDKIRELAAKVPVKLIIVDSIISHFRAEFIGRGALSERQQLLNRYIAELSAFAESNDAVVIVTNQLMARPDILFGDPNAPTGGHIVGHACAYRLYIRKGKTGKRVIRLVKAPDCENGECVVTVTEKGIC